MIKVLQVVKTMNYDGISNFVMNNYRHIDRSQFDFHFTSWSNNPGRFDDEIIRLGGTIHQLPSRSRKPIAYMQALYWLLKRECFDIVHIQQTASSMAMDAFVCRLCGVRIIIGHSHNSGCDSKWRHYLFRPFLNSLVTHRFACSEEAGKWLFGSNTRVHIIRNAIDAPLFSYDKGKRSEIRKELSLDDKFVVGFVGRLETVKNPFRCIDIFHQVAHKRSDAVLLFVGDGTQKKPLQQYAKDKGLESRCIFTGSRSDIHHIVQAMDVFLLPSLHEGLGIVCVEAQAADLPCVVSNNVPAPNINGKCQYLSLDCSDDEWADAVLRVQSGNRMNQSESFVNHGYDIRTEANRLSDLYKAFIS